MVQITTDLIKEIRRLTGAGIIDCKNSLYKANGNIDLAIKNMRKSGIVKAKKTLKNATINGVIKSKLNDKFGVILEVNCQTDFVSKNFLFQEFVDQILDSIFFNKNINTEKLKKKFEQERIKNIIKFGENINIRRFSILEGPKIGGYLHNFRIGTLVSTKGAEEKLNKEIAMHISASKPEFVDSKDIPTEVIKEEYQIQLDIAMQSTKSKEIAKKIAKGKTEKFIENISLTSQPFIFNPKKTIKQILKENNTKIINFIRFELGEDLKKRY